MSAAAVAVTTATGDVTVTLRNNDDDEYPEENGTIGSFCRDLTLLASDADHGPQGHHSWAQVVVSVALVGVIVVATVAGNALVVVAIAVDRGLRGLQHWFIGSLAVSDLLVGAFVVPLALTNELMGYWAFGAAVCRLWLASDVLLCTASILNLVLISLDRYWSITRAVDYVRARTRRRVVAMIATVWTVSMVICLPPLFGWKSPEPVTSGDPKYPVCVISDDPGYVIYSTIGSFYVPLIIMILVYAKIYLVAKQHARKNLKKNDNYCRNASEMTTSDRCDNEPSKLSPLDSNCGGATSRGTCGQVSSDLSEKCCFPDAWTNASQATPDGGNPEPSTTGGKSFPENASSIGIFTTTPVQKRAADATPDTPPDYRTSDVEEGKSRHEDRNPSPLCTLHLSRRATVAGNNDNNRQQELTFDRDVTLPRFRTGDKRLGNKKSSSSSLTSALIYSIDVRRENGSNNDQQQKFRRRVARAKERRATVVLGIVMASFVGCWLPFFSVYPLSLFVGFDVPSGIFSVIFWMGYLNSALNPVIYTIFNPDFRQAFKRLICRKRL